MNDTAVRNLMYTVQTIADNLNTRPESWRDQVSAIRSATRSFEIVDTTPNEGRKQWQLSVIGVFQRVAFADADNGTIHDIADWCLRQALTLRNLYPQDVEIMTLIGRNWLLRAQKSLGNIYRTERDSYSNRDAEQRLQNADYVESRGILVPATEYLRGAVETAYALGNVTSTLLETAAEAHMSLGNVTSTRINARYFEYTMSYLRTAARLPNYSLPAHLQHYLDEYGPLYPSP